jgi:hypothetical protein
MKWGLCAILAGLAVAEANLLLSRLRPRFGDYRGMGARVDRPLWVLRPKRRFRVNALALSPDGTTLATGGWEGADHSICLWDIHTHRLRRSLAGHRDGVSSIAFSPRGDLMVSGSYDKTVMLWDTHTGRLKWTSGDKCGLVHKYGLVQSVAFSPDGRK